MRRVGYPVGETEEHVAEHKRLTEAVREFVIEFHVGSLEHTGPRIAFLREWLADHVNGWDRELGRSRAIPGRLRGAGSAGCTGTDRPSA